MTAVILFVCIFERMRSENMRKNTTTTPARHDQVAVSMAPPEAMRAYTALMPAPSTMPPFTPVGTSVFSCLASPVNPSTRNSNPNSSWTAVIACKRACVPSNPSRNTMTMAMAEVIQPHTLGSPSSQLHEYMLVSKMTSAHATLGSNPNVPVSTANAEYDVAAFMSPVTTSGGEMLKCKNGILIRKMPAGMYGWMPPYSRFRSAI